jgi:hypothetical protein
MKHVTYSTNGIRSTAVLRGWLHQATKGVRYDTMIGIGISGALVVPAIGRTMRKEWALIRKDGVYSHACNVHFEGTIGKRFIIVDDGICSGDTVAVILDKVRKGVQDEFPDTPLPEFVGVWGYNAGASGYLSTDECVRDWYSIERAVDSYTSAAKALVPTGPRPGSIRGCTCEYCNPALTS